MAHTISVRQPGHYVGAGHLEAERDSDSDLVVSKVYTSGAESNLVYVEGSTVVEFVEAIKALYPEKFPKTSVVVGADAYKGNGKHNWEPVFVDDDGDTITARLRVPGGWLYSNAKGDDTNMTFVPLAD